MPIRTPQSPRFAAALALCTTMGHSPPA